jgi:hypothetical protein
MCVCERRGQTVKVVIAYDINVHITTSRCGIHSLHTDFERGMDLLSDGGERRG